MGPRAWSTRPPCLRALSLVQRQSVQWTLPASAGWTRGASRAASSPSSPSRLASPLSPANPKVHPAPQAPDPQTLAPPPSTLPASFDVNPSYDPRFPRAAPPYAAHVPLSPWSRAAMALGSALVSLADPTKGDMVAALSETGTPPGLLRALGAQMRASKSGRALLRDRPLLNSATIPTDALRRLPPTSFGRAYVDFMDGNGFSPDGRSPVHYLDDPDDAYLMTRYRQIHDFTHTLAGLDVSVEAELIVKWFEWVQGGLPVAALSALVGPLKLQPPERARLLDIYIPWALQAGSAATSLLTVRFEDHWDRDLDDFRAALNFIPPPPLTAL